MKIKNLVKLICLLLVVIALGVWAFGANVSLFGTKFIGWHENMIQGSEVGKMQMLTYKITAPTDSKGFDVAAATENAAKVIKARAEVLGYTGAEVRVKGTDSVVVNLPYGELEKFGGVDLFAYNGKAEFQHGSTTVFTNADVKSAKITGVNASGTAYVVEVKLNKDAKAKLQEITSNGAYTIKALIDTNKVSVSLTSSEVIKNGVMAYEFTNTNDMAVFEYILNSGEITGKIALESSSIINGHGGDKAMLFVGLAAVAIIVLAFAYFIISNRVLGVAAALSTLIAVLALEFYAATLPWLLIDAAAITGLALALVLIIGMHILVLQSIAKQYADGKDVISSIDGGVQNVRKLIIELSVVAMVAGAGLWLCGGMVANFGIALLGGGFVTAVTAAFVVGMIAKIFVGLGADKGKSLGLKRGE